MTPTLRIPPDDGEPVRCGACGAVLAEFSAGFDGAGETFPDMVVLMSGYLRPNYERPMFHPSRQLKLKYRRDQEKAERGNRQAAMRLRSGRVRAVSAEVGKSFVTDGNYGFSIGRGGQLRWILRSPTAEAVACVSCGAVNQPLLG